MAMKECMKHSISPGRFPTSPESLPPQRAFTLIELLTLIAILGFLGLLLLPALAKTRPSTQAMVCQNNLRRLLAATQIYASDNSDYLPPNQDDGAAGNWVAGSVSDQVGATNMANLTNPQLARLAPYAGATPGLYKCPADTSTFTIAGIPYPRVRSVSMNGAVGTQRGQISSSPIAVNGPWLDGNHTHSVGQTWRTYGKLADMVVPNPSSLIVFIDEDPLSINDGAFSAEMVSTDWLNFPATSHNYGGTFAFGDGHAEVHQWVDASTRCPNPATRVHVTGSTNDIGWMEARISARIY